MNARQIIIMLVNALLKLREAYETDEFDELLDIAEQYLNTGGNDEEN